MAKTNGPYHNIQQLSDAVMELEKGESGGDVTLLATQVQSLATRVTSLESAVAQLRLELAAVVGNPPKPPQS